MDVGCGKFCPTDLTDFTDDHLIKSMLDGKNLGTFITTTILLRMHEYFF